MLHKLADTDSPGTRGQNYKPWKSPALAPGQYRHLEKRDRVPPPTQPGPGRFLSKRLKEVVVI